MLRSTPRCLDDLNNLVLLNPQSLLPSSSPFTHSPSPAPPPWDILPTLRGPRSLCIDSLSPKQESRKRKSRFTDAKFGLPLLVAYQDRVGFGLLKLMKNVVIGSTLECSEASSSR